MARNREKSPVSFLSPWLLFFEFFAKNNKFCYYIFGSLAYKIEFLKLVILFTWEEKMEKALQVRLFFEGVEYLNQLTKKIEEELNEIERKLNNVKDAKGLLGSIRRLICLKRCEKLFEEANTRILSLRQVEILIGELRSCVEAGLWQDACFFSREVYTKLKDKSPLFHANEAYCVYGIFIVKATDLHEYLSNNIQLTML